jgi:hypothetical protein
MKNNEVFEINDIIESDETDKPEESDVFNEQNNIPIFLECKKCKFKCNKNSQMEKHSNTKKHKTNNNTNNISNNITKQHIIFTCICSSEFNSRTSLWRHRKKCETVLNELNELSLTVTEDGNHTIISNDLVMQLLKQNNDLQLMLIEQSNKMFELAKEAKYVTNNNNSNNNQFNLNVFLNDKCKDALNLDDFVDSLQLQIKDLEETARLGYSDGISRIFINGLRELDIFKRPIHCSDLKRETIYIKEQNIWEKDDVQKTKLSRAIKAIGRKNIKQIFEWQKLYPEYNDSSSKQNDKYNKLICNTMNGSTEEEQAANLNKIIRNVTKEVVIDKAKF